MKINAYNDKDLIYIALGDGSSFVPQKSRQLYPH